jgi:hypothetical protein
VAVSQHRRQPQLIFEECYNIWIDFLTAMLEHCSREAIQVAHELARKLLFLKIFVFGLIHPPSFIFLILSNDVTVLSIE